MCKNVAPKFFVQVEHLHTFGSYLFRMHNTFNLYWLRSSEAYEFDRQEKQTCRITFLRSSSCFSVIKVLILSSFSKSKVCNKKQLKRYR